MSDTNGNTLTNHATIDMNESGIAQTLEEEVTVGYRPVMPLEAMWLAGSDMPQITLRRDIEFMRFHPIVMIAMEYYRAGIAGAEFWGGPDNKNPQNDLGIPISPNPAVAEFVMAHVERFWQRGIPLLQEGGYPYGWAAGEHIYKENNGLMTWSHMKDFHPNDSFILTGAEHTQLAWQPLGVRIKNIRNSQPIDMWLASESIPAKACWYPHKPRFNQLYGQSQYIGAWLPWRMLGWRDGMDQVVNAAVYRGGYVGPIVYHPMEDMQTATQGIPATKVDGQGNPRRSAKDVARQLVEWAKAGAGFTMSSAMYPQSQGGGRKWELVWPEHVMDVRPLIEAARWAEDRIMLGIGVPPELVKAGGTGSGYSGRSIPREAFLDGQQRIADSMLNMFVEQVLKPLVLWNYGDVPFSVHVKSLLKSQADDKQGQDQQGKTGQGGQQGAPDNLNRSQAMKDSWAKRKGPTGTPPPAQSGAPMSLEERTLRIVDRVQNFMKGKAA